jgi:hypothetical protein
VHEPSRLRFAAHVPSCSFGIVLTNNQRTKLPRKRWVMPLQRAARIAECQAPLLDCDDAAALEKAAEFPSRLHIRERNKRAKETRSRRSWPRNIQHLLDDDATPSFRALLQVSSQVSALFNPLPRPRQYVDMHVAS